VGLNFGFGSVGCTGVANNFKEADDKSGFKVFLGMCLSEGNTPENWEKCGQRGKGQISQVSFHF